MLIETHAHLDYPDFAPDFDDVLRRATEQRIVCGATESITEALALVDSAHPEK